jgi:hypothetical protein
MKKLFFSLVDSLHYLFAGEQEEEPAMKQKIRVVSMWLVVIVFCVVMLKLFLGK